MSDEITVSLNNDYITTSLSDDAIGATMGDVVWGLEKDYNNLTNTPIINQDLDADDFVPIANTYYRHIGKLNGFTSGVIYYYNGNIFIAIDGVDRQQPLEVGAKGQIRPSANLMVNGVFLERCDDEV